MYLLDNQPGLRYYVDVEGSGDEPGTAESISRDGAVRERGIVEQCWAEMGGMEVMQKIAWSSVGVLLLICPTVFAAPTYLADVPQYLTYLVDVPAYFWWFGSAPASGGMVIGYWDAQPGYGALVHGDVTGFGFTAQRMIGSSLGDADAPGLSHRGDYWDDYLSAGPDPYIVAGVEPHADNSLADFMLSNRSVLGLVDGGTALGNIGPGMVAWAAWDGAAGPGNAGSSPFVATSRNYYYDVDLTFDVVVVEIDAERPVVLTFMGFDHLGQVNTHAVTAFGYEVDDQDREWVAVLDTWGHDEAGQQMRDMFTANFDTRVDGNNIHWWAWSLFNDDYDEGYGARLVTTFEMAEIPEPGTLLLLVGAVGLIALRTRTRSA